MQNQLGILHLDQQQFDKAIADFSRAENIIKQNIKLQKQHPILILNKAIAYKVGKKQYKDVLQMYAQAEDMLKAWNINEVNDFQLSNVYYNFGCIYYEHNKLAQAFDYY